MTRLPSNWYKRKTEEGLTCLQMKDILKRDLSKKGVVDYEKWDNFDRQADRRSMS